MNNTMNNTNASKTWTFNKMFPVIAIVAGLFLLVYFNFHAAAQLQHESARYKSMEHFIEMQQRQDRVASEIELMRNQLYTMYHTCRSADDFFGVFDHEIAYVANSHQLGSLQVLVKAPPEGSHQLRVVVTQGSPKTKQTDLCRKTISLESGQASKIQLDCGWEEEENKKPRNVMLIMDEEEIELLMPRFSITSKGHTSSGSHRFFRQPNQKVFYSDKESHNKIVDLSFSGDGENEKVCIQIFVDSEGPIRSAADDAKTVGELISRLHLNEADEKIQYDPRGWYTFE